MHSQGNDFCWKMINTETERQHKKYIYIQFIHTASEVTVKSVWTSEGETCVCAPVSCHSGKSSPFTGKWGRGGLLQVACVVCRCGRRTHEDMGAMVLN